MNSGSLNQLGVLEAASATEEIDLRAYWDIVFRYRWSLISFVFLCSLVVSVFVYSMTPVFRANATLLIEADEANIVSIEEVYGVDSSQQEYYQTQFEILNSRTLSERVIDVLEIAEHQEYQPRKSAFKLPFRLSPEVSPSQEQKRVALVNQFRSNLIVSPIRNTQLVTIGFESNDPELAAEVANSIGEAYIDSHLEAKLELTQKASEWLTERLSGMRDSLQQSEISLREFQEQENLIDVSGVQTLTAKELDEQTRRLVEARKQVASAKNQMDAAGNSEGPYQFSWESLSSVLKDSLAQNLRIEEASAEKAYSEVSKRYGPKHPTYVATVSNLESASQAYQARVLQIVRGLGNHYRELLSNQRDIEESLEESKQEIQEINRKSYQLSQLQRSVNTNKQLYDMFFQRFQETNQTDFAAANARFVDRAVRPFEPTKPNKPLIIGAAGVLSLLFGIFLVFVRHSLDNTIRSPEDLEQKLGQGVLGVVPFEAKLSANTKAARLYLEDDHHTFSEAINSLRTSVVLSGLNAGHKLVVVTSSLPGEGKTTISSNLALSLGQMEKVILIDADMRRPSLASEYELSRGTQGLAELVAGTGNAKDCILPIDSMGIDLIPAGTVPSNPLDLLSSQRFEELLHQLRSRYDRIIIDSAPTQAVSDSMVLSTKADALVYVIKSDSTPVNIALNGLDRLQRVGAPTIGVVLNQFDVSARKYGYYGGAGANGYYGYGYASKNY